MKIGINASFLRKPDTGIGQVTRGFINELVSSKSSEDTYFLYLEKDIDLNLPKNFRKRVFLPSFWRRDDLVRKIWWEKFLLPRMAARDKCDSFLSPYQCPSVFSEKIRHTMLVHDMIWKIFPEYLDNWRKKLYAYLTYRAVRKADRIRAVSEWSKRDIRKYLKIPARKIKIASPSVGDEFFKKKSAESDNVILEKYGVTGRYIFYVGGFDLRKNIPSLLEAFGFLLDKQGNQNINLVLAGEDKSKYSPLFTDVKKEIRKLGLEKNTELVGFVKQEDLPAFYRQAEMYILPTLYEGFGLMVLEAMASGAPTAVSKSSSLLEVGGHAVLYFNPYDTEEMTRVMGKIMRNPEFRHRLSEKGKERAKKFSWKKFAENFIG